MLDMVNESHVEPNQCHLACTAVPDPTDHKKNLKTEEPSFQYQQPGRSERERVEQ